MPPEYLEQLLSEDESLPDPDVVLGLQPHSEAEAPSEPPSLEDLMSNPDIAAVVAAVVDLQAASA